MTCNVHKSACSSCNRPGRLPLFRPAGPRPFEGDMSNE